MCAITSQSFIKEDKIIRKVKKCLPIAALILSLNYATSLYAAQPTADPATPSLNKHGVSTVKGHGSSSGSGEMSEGTLGSAPSVQELNALSLPSISVAATCNYWWVNGKHTWSWSGLAYIGIKVNLNASSWTTYGTSTGSCGLPLIVDRLKVEASTAGGTFIITARNTLYNVSSVSASNTFYGLATSPPCGGRSYHEAYKSGITWYVFAKSGCA